VVDRTPGLLSRTSPLLRESYRADTDPRIENAEDFLMLRPATQADLPTLVAIRNRAGADALSDPALVKEADLHRLIAAGAVMVADETGSIVGFAGIDGNRIHLLVDTAQRSKGLGRALLYWACDAVRDAGHTAATLTLAAQNTTERHYRAAGWGEIGRSPAGGVVLKKPC
jgi:GNAT superfamily N-acetyltransferase